MVHLPEILPYAMREKLVGEHTPDAVIESLCPTNFEELDKGKQKKHLNRLAIFFEAVCKDETWIPSNNALAEKLFRKTITLYQCNTKYKERLRRILAYSFPKFKAIEGLDDDVVFRISDSTVKANSKVLGWQSDFFEKMLLGSSAYNTDLHGEIKP